MSSTNSNLFNVEEVTGKEAALLETTAAEARIQAPNSRVADQIDRNAEMEKGVAQQAASMAQRLGPSFTGKTPKSAVQVNPLTAGNERSEIRTTADEALGKAPNLHVAYQVGENAQKEQDAAQQAAARAKTLGSKYTGEPSTATEQFKGDASRTTNAAVAEGKHDVEHVKAVGADYVEQAKNLAASAFETAQTYLSGKPAEAPDSTTYTPSSSVTETGANVLASIQSTAQNAYQSAQPHIQNAYHTAQPHIENVYSTIKETAQPHIERASDAAQEYLGATKSTGDNIPSNLKPASAHNIPASSAPLETGSKTVKSPYDGVSSGLATSPTVSN